MTGTRLLKSSALVALAAATLAVPSIASAQEHDHDRGGGEHRGGSNGNNGGGGRPQQAAPQQQMQRPQQFQQQQRPQFQAPQQQFQAQRQQQMQQQFQAQRRFQGQAAQQPGGGWQGRYQGQGQQSAPVYQGQNQGRNQAYIDGQRNRDYRGEHRDFDRHDFDRRDGNRGQLQGYRGGQQAWNNGWRRDGRYNWQNYRNEHRDVFRAGRYYAPYNNYYYRPLGIGFFLDEAFFGEDYWIGDPGYYSLPPAYGPYRWVRYYNDVLLVNIYTGEVVDEIHNFFW